MSSQKLKCPLCTDTRYLPFRQHDILEHVIMTFDRRHHIHIHGPVQNRNLMTMFLLALAKEAGIEIEAEDTGNIEQRNSSYEETIEETESSGQEDQDVGEADRSAAEDTEL